MLIKKLFLSFSVLILFASVISCASETSTEPKEEVKEEVIRITISTNSIAINPNSVTKVVIGKSLQLGVNIETEGGASEDVEWSSGDESIATVDANGLVTGVAAGTVMITVTSTADNSKIASISIEVVPFLENVFNISDDNNLELDGAISVTTAEVGGTTYLFVAGLEDDGVSVFNVDPNDGTLLNITNVDDSDDNNLELDGANSVTTAEVGGTTYLFVAGFLDDGVSMFSVANDGKLSNVTNVADDNDLNLDSVSSVTTAEVGGTTYLFAAGQSDGGVSVFSVKNDGTLSNVYNVDDSDDGNLKLGRVSSVTTAVVDTTTYLFASAADSFDPGVSMFKVEPNGSLNNVANVADNSNLKLKQARSVTTAEVEGTTYLFVAGQFDSGISVFSVDPNDGTLINVANVADSDDDDLKLKQARSVTTAQVGGTTYLFVAGSEDDGVSVFSVDSNDGSLNNVANVADSDDSSLELDGASSVTTAEVGGTTYLFVTGTTDNGVSVFRINE